MEKSHYKKQAIELINKANIRLTPKEQSELEIASFNLPNYPVSGLQIVTYYNSPQYCAKELIMFPMQTCPEHRHPPVGHSPGKQETFRCRYGEVYLFVDDETLELNSNLVCKPPIGDENWYTCNRFIKLTPGEQYTIKPNTLHWFQAGKAGAIVSEFSTESTDQFDIFTDPRIIRNASL